MTKKILSLILCVCMIVALVGCGGGGSSTTAAPDTTKAAENESSKEATKEPAKEPVVLRIGGGLAPTHIVTECSDEICKRVKEATNGEVIIENYPNSQLGSVAERVAMTISGELDIIQQALSAFDAYNPKQGVMSAFFMFENWDHYKAFSESDLYSELVKGMEEACEVKVLGSIYYSERNFYTKNEIKTMADLKGVMFRVPNEIMPIDFMKALGASPTPLAMSETYTALQNGTVQGIECGAEQAVTNAYPEVTSYMTFTRHQYQTMNYIMSNAAIAKLTPEQFEIVTRVIKETCAEYEPLSIAREAERVEEVRQAMTVNEIDLSEFYAVAESIYDNYDDVWGDGTWEAIKAFAK